ncbi:MAG: glycosyl hydrolase family 18 protein [Bacillota bacterium]
MFSRLKLPTLLICFAALIFSSGFSSPGQTNRLLAQGDYGADVRTLQEQLQQLGYFQASPTGYFGPLTALAVTGLQKDARLRADGIVGPQTRAAIDALLQRKSSRPRIVHCYYTGAEGPLPSSAAVLAAQSGVLTQVAPFWYQLDPRGNGDLILQADVIQEEVRRLVKTAREQNVKVLALVHNLLYNKGIDGREAAHRVLAGKENRQALIKNLLAVIQENGFAGIEIDLENIYPRDRQLFNQFIKELADALAPRQYYLSVALPARLDEQTGLSWSDSFDYGTVGRYAHQVVIMAYDEHGVFSGAGPVASLPWVEKVICSVLREIPPDKIILGIPAYGFDWNEDREEPRYISYAIAMATARRYQQPISWDERAQVPYFTYVDENGSRHEVYFENASSWAGKLDLAVKYNLGGVAVWRLGLEDPKGWEVLKSKFPGRKL